MHGFETLAEFKKHYNLESTQCQAKRDALTGDKNPAYNHAGLYSAWSTNFLHGYSAERHAAKNKNQSEYILGHKDKHVNFIEYWIAQAEGDVELGTQLYKQFQTKNLDFFVAKYGEIEGKARHVAKTKKWLDTMYSKSDSELADINERKVQKSSSFFSAAEKELFAVLQEHVAELSAQKAIIRSDTENKRFFLYDMCYNNKIIEYNGDFWHANPKFYSSDFVNPYNKRTQAEIIARDKVKHQTAIDAGYELLVIWEHEYKNNKQEIIQRCINFLTQ